MSTQAKPMGSSEFAFCYLAKIQFDRKMQRRPFSLFYFFDGNESILAQQNIKPERDCNNEQRRSAKLTQKTYSR